MAEEVISWDDAVSAGNFVTLTEDKEKVISITNWKFERVPNDAKVAAGEIELKADVLEEDGQPATGKVFSTTSRRLKVKLRPLLENKKPTEKVTISILRVGEKFNTQYSVKEVTAPEPAPAPAESASPQ